MGLPREPTIYDAVSRVCPLRQCVDHSGRGLLAPRGGADSQDLPRRRTPGRRSSVPRSFLAQARDRRRRGCGFVQHGTGRVGHRHPLSGRSRPPGLPRPTQQLPRPICAPRPRGQITPPRWAWMLPSTGTRPPALLARMTIRSFTMEISTCPSISLARIPAHDPAHPCTAGILPALFTHALTCLRSLHPMNLTADDRALLSGRAGAGCPACHADHRHLGAHLRGRPFGSCGQRTGGRSKLPQSRRRWAGVPPRLGGPGARCASTTLNPAGMDLPGLAQDGHLRSVRCQTGRNSGHL